MEANSFEGVLGGASKDGPQASAYAHAQSTSEQTEYMRRIAQIVVFSWQRRIHKERVGRTESAVPRMNMPKDMKHRLDAAHCGEKLLASCVILSAGCLIEDAIWWAMCDQDIRISGDTRVELRSIPVRDDAKGFAQEGRRWRSPYF